ncbi:MAG: S41 family peptidase [Pseudomonadota bacterium]
MTFLSRFSLVSVLIALAFAPAWAQDKGGTKAEDAVETASPAKKVEDPNEIYRQLDLFGDIFERVRGQYVEDVTDKELIEAAVNGMLVSLDAHSSYLTETDFKDMKIQTSGEFGGLGIEVTMEDGLVKVVSPIDDTPAYRAGIKAGDYITHLDGKPVIGLTLSEAVEKMRGRVGAPIEITVRREGVNDPIELTLKRDVIRIRPVKHNIEGASKDVGYIRVTTFNQYTDAELEDAIADIQKQKGDNLIGYVLDLRNNPGGLLDQAISVADMFLERGEIVSTRGRKAEDTKRDNATPGDLTNGLPVIVLINGGSASASEIVAGALQDHKRAIVLGTTSFGKGSVQTVIPVQGNGAIRLTTARYYTPSGRSIQGKGIVPDIEVVEGRIETVEDKGNIKEADLAHALINTDKEPEVNKIEEEKPSILPWVRKKQEEKLEKEKSKQIGEEASKSDLQLQRAVDLLRGLAITGAWDKKPEVAVKDSLSKEERAAAALEPQSAPATTKKK